MNKLIKKQQQFDNYILYNREGARLIPKAQFGTGLVRRGLRWISNHMAPTREQTMFEVQNNRKKELQKKKEETNKSRTAADLQRDLIKFGYLSKGEDDGAIGSKTRKAIAKAKEDGYTVNMNTFTVTDTKQKQSKRSLLDKLFETPILSFKKSHKNISQEEASKQKEVKKKDAITPISLDKAKKLYQNGAGMIDVLAAGFWHFIEPTGLVPMLHSDNLKNQIAAEIAYNESLPKRKREKDPHGISKNYIGYSMHGTLSNQSTNINQQSNKNNATAKIMGGYRYTINEDGSVDVIDPFSFDIIRNFNNKKDGKPEVLKNSSDDIFTNWGIFSSLAANLGAIKDIINGPTNFQDFMENYFTRQGRTRSNNIHFAPGEIDKRNSGQSPNVIKDSDESNKNWQFK